MSKGFAENVGANVVGSVVGGSIVTWLTLAAAQAGTALAYLFWLVGVLLTVAFTIIFIRYVGVLGQGAEPEGSAERAAYDALRQNLAEGGLPARIYAGRLTGFLDAVDWFLGDAGMADRTLFPRAFGLKTPAPLWTAQSLDRCLLLALVYPIATIFIIWAVSGHVGPAEAALGLSGHVPGWRRGLVVMLLAIAAASLWKSLKSEGWERFAWLAFAGAGVVADAGAGAGAVAVAAAAVFAGAFAGAGVVAGAGAVAVAAAVVFAGAGAVAVVFAGAGAVAVLNDRFLTRGRQGAFLSLFLPTMILVCLVAARFASLYETWDVGGPLLLFVGLLTLLNAPFDWVSIGVTRALLRRGIKLEGWWPYGLAFVDAVLAVGVIALLACTMVVGVQAFDFLAVQGGGKPVLPLDTLFDGVAADPAAPEFWWVYALLLSTMIPSILNLAIGGASLIRGFPGVSRFLLGFMPAGKPVPDFDRAWIACVLTAQ